GGHGPFRGLGAPRALTGHYRDAPTQASGLYARVGQWDRSLFGDGVASARRIDERRLVEASCGPLGTRARCQQRRHVVEPELDDAIEIRRARITRDTNRARLHESTYAWDARADRSVHVAPVAVELFIGQVRPLSKAVDDLDHRLARECYCLTLD